MGNNSQKRQRKIRLLPEKNPGENGRKAFFSLPILVVILTAFLLYLCARLYPTVSPSKLVWAIVVVSALIVFGFDSIIKRLRRRKREGE